MKYPKELRSADPDLRRSWIAINQAARLARQIAKATGTPLYIMRKGKIVNLNAGARQRKPFWKYI